MSNIITCSSRALTVNIPGKPFQNVEGSEFAEMVIEKECLPEMQ